MPSVITQAAQTPCNTTVVVLCCVIFFYMWNARMTFEHVSVSYRKLVENKQYYRVITSAFTHLDFMHIVFNMAGLWSIGPLEAWLGSFWYVETTILLLFLCAAGWVGIVHGLLAYGSSRLTSSLPGGGGATSNMSTRIAQLADASAVGYSGVLFGWMTLMMMVDASYSIPLPGGITIPIVVMPFVYLLVTKLLIPRSSFLGHLAGIVAGYAVGWGLFDWIRGYWLWSFTLIALVILVLSISANTTASLLPRWISRCVQVSPEYAATTPLSALHYGAGAAAEEDGTNGNNGQTGLRRFLDNGILRVFRPLRRDEVIVVPASTVAMTGSSQVPPPPPPLSSSTSLGQQRQQRSGTGAAAMSSANIAPTFTEGGSSGAAGTLAPGVASSSNIPFAAAANSSSASSSSSFGTDALRRLLSNRFGPATASTEAESLNANARATTFIDNSHTANARNSRNGWHQEDAHV